MSVFVLDKRKRPVMPCSEQRAHTLLARGHAVVHRRYPFTIRLKDRIGGEVQRVRVKIDPGGKTAGVVVVTDEDGNEPAKVLCLFELSHQGRQRRRGGSCRALMPGTARSSDVPTGTNISNKGRRFLYRLLPAVCAPISDDFG